MLEALTPELTCSIYVSSKYYRYILVVTANLQPIGQGRQISPICLAYSSLETFHWSLCVSLEPVLKHLCKKSLSFFSPAI